MLWARCFHPSICRLLRPQASPRAQLTPCPRPADNAGRRSYSHQLPLHKPSAPPFKSYHGSRAHPTFPKARRRFSNTATVAHGHITPPKPGEELHVTFIDKDGGEHTFEVSAGDNLMDIAQAEDLEMEGACGGSCACSTCHVIVEEPDKFEAMPEPSDDENDMLDLAFGLTETSRLGCQVKMSKEIDGVKVRLPSMTRNLQAADFKGSKKE
ncbi:MAG: hypothetical protein LQ343_002904 [Gyalolechia ehrenbergii]|nr:MAG: hypothetical protein LQ343_002904 [Gyalolechia ehrenbergii]